MTDMTGGHNVTYPIESLESDGLKDGRSKEEGKTPHL